MYQYCPMAMTTAVVGLVGPGWAVLLTIAEARALVSEGNRSL